MSGWTYTMLRSQKTGILCCFASVALLGGGSFYMDWRPDLYEGLRADDLRFFLLPPRLEHLWLYLLAAVLGLWGASSAVCALDTFRARRPRGLLHAVAHGPILLHVAFPLALVAHLWSGLAGWSTAHKIQADGAVVAGAHLRPMALREERHPNGMPRQVTVTLEKTEAGRTSQVEIGYNRPLILDAGARVLLLGQYMELPVAVLRIGDQTVRLAKGEPTQLGGTTLMLERIFPASASVPVPMVGVRIAGQTRRAWLRVGQPTPGEAFVCTALQTAPTLLLTERWNPSIPLVVFASLLAAAGVLLCIRDHARRRV